MPPPAFLVLFVEVEAGVDTTTDGLLDFIVELSLFFKAEVLSALCKFGLLYIDGALLTVTGFGVSSVP